MRVTDTDSKGKIIVQNRGGVYMGLFEDELEEAINALIEVKEHREKGFPRKVLDSRKNY